MKKEMKKLSFEELDQISGGTTAETAELLELIKANPELNRTYNNGLKFHDGNVNHAVEYVLYMRFEFNADLFENEDNLYGYSFGKRRTHAEVCEMLKNF